MKKILVFLMGIMFINTNVNGADIIYDGIYYDILSTNDMTLSVVGYNASKSNDIIIPDIINYRNRIYTPVKIATAAFQDTKLHSIKIGKNITTIGFWAFKNCDRLEELEIPDNVVTLEYTNIRYCNLCDNCDKLTKIIIGNGISYIPAGAFNNCPNLKEITFGTNVQNIDTGSGLIACTFPQESENFCKITLLSIEPPCITTMFYANIDYTCIDLYVPVESIEYYKEDSEWGKFSFIYSTNEITPIKEIKYNTVKDKKTYNLQGYEINSYSKGIIIRNGKKYYVK